MDYSSGENLKIKINMEYLKKNIDKIIKNEDSFAALKIASGKYFDQELVSEGINWFRAEYQKSVHQYPGDNQYYEELTKVLLTGESFLYAKIKCERSLCFDFQRKQLTYLTTGKI